MSDVVEGAPYAAPVVLNIDSESGTRIKAVASENTTCLAQAYDMHDGRFTINGEPFPYWLEEGGPRVEQIEPGLPFHILWLPVLVEAPLAGYMHEKPGQSAEPACANHKPVQHRDGKPPWCDNCREGKQ